MLHVLDSLCFSHTSFLAGHNTGVNVDKSDAEESKEMLGTLGSDGCKVSGGVMDTLNDNTKPHKDVEEPPVLMNGTCVSTGNTGMSTQFYVLPLFIPLISCFSAVLANQIVGAAENDEESKETEMTESIEKNEESKETEVTESFASREALTGEITKQIGEKFEAMKPELLAQVSAVVTDLFDDCTKALVSEINTTLGEHFAPVKETLLGRGRTESLSSNESMLDKKEEEVEPEEEASSSSETVMKVGDRVCLRKSGFFGKVKSIENNRVGVEWENAGKKKYESVEDMDKLSVHSLEKKRARNNQSTDDGGKKKQKKCN